MLVHYLDAATDRLARRDNVAFETMVDAVRVGYVTARDAKAYRRWQSRRRADGTKPSLSGANLEQAIRGLALTHPEYVVMGPA